MRIVDPAGDLAQGELLHGGELGAGEGRPRETLGQQGRGRRKVLAQGRDAAVHGEPAGADRHLGPDRIEEVGGLLGRMVGGAAVEHRGQQGGPAGRLGRIGQAAAEHEHLEVDQRQMGVVLDEHAQAVGQHLLMDFAVGRPRPAVGRFRCPARRGDNDPIEPFGDEIAPGDVPDLLGGDLSDAFDIRFVEQRIGGRDQVPPQRVGYPLHGLPAEHELGHLLLFGLGQFLGPDELLAEAVDLVEDFVGCPPPGLGAAGGLDGKHAGDIVGRFAGGADGQRHPLVVLQPLDQPRAVALAQDIGRQVQRIEIGVRELHRGPGEGQLVHARRPSRGRPRAAQLVGLVIQGHVGLASAGRAGVLAGDLGEHLRRGHVADDHEHLVVRHVPLAVEIDDRAVRGGTEHVEVADHRAARRVVRIDDLLQQRAQHPLAVHFAVGQLAADHLQLALELGRLEGDPLHRVGHQADRRQDVLCRAIDVVIGHVGRGGGVRHPAERSDDLFDFLFGVPRGGAARNDVLQHVAYAGPEVLSLVSAAGVLDEAAHGGHRRRVVLLDQYREPIVQDSHGRLGGQSLGARIDRRSGCRRGRRPDAGVVVGRRRPCQAWNGQCQQNCQQAGIEFHGLLLNLGCRSTRRWAWFEPLIFPQSRPRGQCWVLHGPPADAYNAVSVV